MFRSFSTTGIGSLPHRDPQVASGITLEAVDIPFWPQLPHRSFLELMVPQYSEGFPFVRIEGEHIIVDRTQQTDIATFYEAVAAEEEFPISREYAAGLHAFMDRLKTRGQTVKALKGHVTGPLTFTLSLTDSQKRPVYFDEELRELALALLKGKVSWQISLLKQHAEEVLIFIDEPILSALGTSAYLGVSAEEAARMLRDIVDHTRSAGGIPGIHCCGKADWPLVLSSGVSVFNFDAYFFWDTLSIYPDEVRSFLDQGGYIAWGVVPTTDAIRDVTLQGLREQLERGLTSLEKNDISPDRVRRQALLTPSCGTGSLSSEEALHVFTLLKDLRNSYVRN